MISTPTPSAVGNTSGRVRKTWRNPAIRNSHVAVDLRRSRRYTAIGEGSTHLVYDAAGGASNQPARKQPSIIPTSYQDGVGDTAAMDPIEKHYERGVAFKRQGKYDKAVVQFQTILKVEPRHAAARRQLGLVYGFMGRFEESLEELRQAVELDGLDVSARNDLALTCAMLGMFDEAKTHFQTVLESDPENTVAKRHLALF